MDSRMEQTIKNKVSEYEQQVGAPVNADALWGRLEERAQPVRKTKKRHYAVASALALLIVGSAITVAMMQRHKPEGQIAQHVSALEVAHSLQADVAEMVSEPVAIRSVAETRTHSDIASKPKGANTCNALVVDEVTQYLQQMEIPSIAGLSAGKDDMSQGDDQYSGDEWICY
ncbi:MAG: hypothetical protein KF744_02415 [Taibaiella sp.]|nr:hypothetical protein [Taibaiella sp.]